MTDLLDGKHFVAVMNAYALKVVADVKGEFYGLQERLACQRHLDDLERSKSDDFPYELDLWFVADICNFAQKIKHVDGNWDIPTIVLHETQVFIFGSLIGWRRKDNWQKKRFRYGYLGFARKNAKSTNAAILGLYCLTMENELGAQIVTSATKTEQALIVLHMMHRMAAASKGMQRALGLNLKKADSISCMRGNGIAKALSNDAKTHDGLNPHLAVLDEFHAHKKRDLFDVITSAFGARKNPLMIIITTAGYDLLSACYAEYQMCLELLDPKNEKINDEYFVMIYTIDKGDDIFCEKVWRKANPLYGISVQPEYMESRALAAKNSEANIADFETKNLNIWRHGSASWLNMRKFKKCANPKLMDDLSVHTENGGEVVLGVDLSMVSDMTAIAVNWRNNKAHLRSIVYNYLPRGTIENRELPNHEQYVRWRDDGYLNQIEGDRISTNDIRDDIFDLIETLNVREVVFDFYCGADQICADIEEKYPEVTAFVLKKNAHNVSVATNDFEAQVISQHFQHDGCPILEWQASNVHVTKRVDGSLLAKKDQPDSHNKIDGIDAIIQGNTRLIGVGEVDQTITDLSGVFA